MFQCKDLLTLPSLSKARILSGQSGLSNGIRWVYKPENMQFSKWVRGRELMIISTPVIQSRDFNLMQLIKEAVRLKMAGALLLVGSRYIEKISRDVLTYTDQNRFPLFAISGDTPLIDIFEEIGHAIAYHDSTDSDSEDVLSGIIFGSEINVDALIYKSELLGYDISLPQQIFVMHLYSPGRVELYDRDLLSGKIRESFSGQNISIVLSHYGSNFVGMFHTPENMQEQIRLVFESLKKAIREDYPGWTVCMGISRSCERLERLQNSFKEASRCVMLADKTDQRDGIFCYQNLGFYNLLFELEDTRPVEDFIDAAIGPILRYDEENHTELLKTLKVYLQNNSSLLHTSQLLHTHRNTIKYRIQRVEEITGRSLESSMTRLEFMNAILCREICRF